MATFTLQKDTLRQCPYDPNHKIAIRNWIKHMLECEKKSGSNFWICYYNASHRMARCESASHLRSCPDARQHMRETDASSHQHMSAESQADNQWQRPNTSQTHESICGSIGNTEETIESNKDNDDWDDDNCPNYDMYNKFGTSVECNSEPNMKTTQKLTKNQKKRMRRKAAVDTKPQPNQCTSIWD